MKTPQTLVRIVASRLVDGVVTTDLLVVDGAWPSMPLAPATIWRQTAPAEPVLDLHRLVSSEATEARFESYTPDAAPVADEPFSFYAWWTPDQLEAARDTTLDWARRTYDGHDHDHCLLTWEAIEPGDPAYVSMVGWISNEAYRRFIENDELRLRSTPTHLAPAKDHYLTRALPAAFDWLVDEAGYQSKLVLGPPGRLWVHYCSTRTRIKVYANVQTNDEAAVHVSLAPAGGTYCDLKECLEMHGLEPVDLCVPTTVYPDRERLLRTVDIASKTLRQLIPWEVAGNWEQDG